MKIGLISDTHGYLDPEVFRHFEDCDEVWHAGDIGSVKILDDLSSFKTSRMVWGNIDSHEIRSMTKENLWFEIEGKSIWITHIGASPPRYNKTIRPELLRLKPALFVCGHSHICKVFYDKTLNILYINPGAAGRHGFHKMRTLLRFDITLDGFKNLEVIELGSRSLKQ